MFNNNLQMWFKANKRSMPWRSSNSPYFIWLSEIILQQTRVEQGTPYFLKFIDAYPTIFDLAAAPIDDILKLWQGLGYYSRARNLHFAANQIVKDYKGIFPKKYKDLMSLKGIGDYTASAILSICYGLPYAVLDGNVYRVLSRIHLDDTPINLPKSSQHFKKLAEELLDKSKSGSHNEAMMELGATICTPRNPKCADCPVQEYCKAYSRDLQNTLPVKLKQAPKKERYLHYFLIKVEKGKYLIERRESQGIWEGLYQLPFYESDKRNDLSQILNTMPILLKEVTHILTHQRLFIRFYNVEERDFKNELNIYYLRLNIDDLKTKSFPKPIWDFLEDFVFVNQ